MLAVLALLVIGVCIVLYLMSGRPRISDIYYGNITKSGRNDTAYVAVRDLREDNGPLYGMSHGLNDVKVAQYTFTRIDTEDTVEEPMVINGRQLTLLKRNNGFQLPDVGSGYVYWTRHHFRSCYVVILRLDEDNVAVFIRASW